MVPGIPETPYGDTFREERFSVPIAIESRADVILLASEKADLVW